MSTYRSTFSISRLWLILGIGSVCMFGILLLIGREIYQVAPPMPSVVRTLEGDVLFTGHEIERGQNIWQSMGGMQQGSIWGHGAYLAPDWSADWLHREASALLNIVAAHQTTPVIGSDGQDIAAGLDALRQMRGNTYDPSTGAITVSTARAMAIREVEKHFTELYSGVGDGAMDQRRDYAFPLHAKLNLADAHDLSGFYFWTAWSASTERPDSTITYTSNWPHEPLVGNRPTTATLLWSIASVIFLLAGIGALVWYYARQFDAWNTDAVPEGGLAMSDFLDSAAITPSMRATAKYFWVVCALFAAQVLMGIVTAHYAVEGQGLYGLPFAEYLPYAVTRTWHTQLAVLWIATAWLATGLYVAPLLIGKDPKFQRLGVNILFCALLIVVVGSFAGQWAAVHRFFDDLTINFWFGHQGYEYVDLGRFWQICLTVGLFLWVVLVLRALWPVLNAPGGKSLVALVAVSTVAIGILYAAGLMWGEHTHIAIMEYWRWWVVHLWVEGIFEVFATAIISVLFVRMGILRATTATVMVLFATIIFLFGGVLGTLHHLYFSGTPTSVIALGASFSALEVVPLVLIGFEAYNRAQVEHGRDWELNYRWPFMFFGAVLFWNMVGAGLFGFLINPPIALYYMQGLNTTANHGHGSLFGVYGMLGLGLTLYCLRGLTDVLVWDQKLLKIAFWCLNIGLGMMTFLSLLPQGIWQTYASIEHGYAYARSAEFVHSAIMEGFVWMRVPGDLVFSLGVLAFVLFVAKATLASHRSATGTKLADT